MSLGLFEGKDIAKWLPQLMASASGMRGASGTAEMFAHLEAVRNVTGSSDQAGNAYDNYLAYLKSPEAAKTFEDYGVNLTKGADRLQLQGSLHPGSLCRHPRKARGQHQPDCPEPAKSGLRRQRRRKNGKSSNSSLISQKRQPSRRLSATGRQGWGAAGMILGKDMIASVKKNWRAVKARFKKF